MKLQFFLRKLAFRPLLRWGLPALALVLVLGVAGERAISGTLVGSKHDMTSLNARAGVQAMTGLAFNDYRDACIYCHIPDSLKGNEAFAPGGTQIAEWNRYLPEGEIQLYRSETLRGKVGELGAESLICLSCHDGTMAIDMVVNKPKDWQSKDEAPLHMKLDKGGGLDRCTQCHDGTTAHKMDSVVVGRSLMDDHPVGIKYPGSFDDPDFNRPTMDGRLRNGVRLFKNQVECATCHDVHNPDIVPFLRVEQRVLCTTCHNK
jgi:predicted CXXCH cytochrome family protein